MLDQNVGPFRNRKGKDKGYLFDDLVPTKQPNKYCKASSKPGDRLKHYEQGASCLQAS